MAHLYRVSDNAPLVAGSTVTLEGDEARHASSVARLTPGENVALTDGRGLMAQSVVQESSAQRVTLVVASVEDVAPLTPEVWLVQALAKGDRDERAVEACTELGVDRIIPWQAARSVARWSGAKIEKSVARWQRIAGEASKQSLRAWVPGVENMVELQQLVDMASSTRMVLLEPMASLALHQAIPAGDQPVVLVVGPEGGISPEEREALENAGATSASLGPLVMRTSTAGVAALSVLNHTLGRFE
jgi:16S rRNA (uracil1498-N3)-methyltransferase